MDTRDPIPTLLVVNGRRHDLVLDPRATLLDTLRDELQLYGTKKGCDHGVCGACTVLINGKRRICCLTLAASHDGDTITTIEGVAGADGALHPVQQAFIDFDGFQCGYCTPGQIMSAIGLIDEGGAGDPAAIKEGIENQCRCGCYANIVNAVAAAATQVRARTAEPTGPGREGDA